MNEVEIGILSGLVVAIISLVQHILKTKNDRRKREFDTYHRLITELLFPEMKYKEVIEKVIEKQAAIVYELRTYKRYAEISKRILGNLKAKKQGNFADKFLLDEIDKTLEVLA